MSPSQFHNFHSNRETNNKNASLCPPPLKINKDSHFTKKPQSSPPSSSSTASSLVNGVRAAATKPQRCHPVIIYTHSPKIIHTHPQDFMALVQKLTGLPHSKEKEPPKQDPGSHDKEDGDDHKIKVVSNEDNENTSSVVTDDDNNSGGSVGDNQVSSSFVALPILEPPLKAYVANLVPEFTPNPAAEFLCSKQPLLNCTDALFFSHRRMMSSIPSSATLEVVKRFPAY